MPTPALISTVELARLAYSDLPKYPARQGFELANALGLKVVELRGRRYVNRAAALAALANFPQQQQEFRHVPRSKPLPRERNPILHVAIGGRD